jgi:hypothetical protein
MATVACQAPPSSPGPREASGLDHASRCTTSGRTTRAHRAWARRRPIDGGK